MQLSLNFLRRFRRVNFPGAMLMLLLQRTPVLSIVATVEEMVFASPVGTVLKSAVAAVAALGAVNTLVGASSLNVSSGTSTGITVPAGTAMSVSFSLPGSDNTSHPTALWDLGIQAGSSFPPGLTFSTLTAPGTVVVKFPQLSGTPTTAGTYNLTFQAFSADRGFSSPAYKYTVTVTGSVNVAPAFTLQPANQTVTAGSPVTFTCTATGTPTPAFQWKKGGVAIAGATNSSYMIATTVAGDAGNYTVVATNTVSAVTSNTATLTVNVAPAFTLQPASQAVTAGSPVTFTATATGTPTPTFQWKKGGVAIAGATGSSYMISSPVAGDAGNYTVVATNSVSAVTSNIATLTVNPANVAPAFTLQPVAQTVNAGSPVTFTVTATGTPAPTFQWKKDGVAIGGATGSTYTIASTVAGDAGSYTVVATNSVTSVTSNAAALAVNVAPAFSVQPAGQAVTVGGPVTFTAAASGTPAPTFQWKKNGVAINGATGTSLLIASTATGDAGSYTVVATNSVTSVTSNPAVLTINVAPAFTTQPVSASVTDGSGVKFTVAAGGAPAPVFQWQLSTDGGTTWNDLANDSTYAGVTTPTLGLDHTIATMMGNQYRCTVTNSVSQVISQAAILTTLTASANFNHDAFADILWHNTSTGLVSSWTTNGSFQVFGVEGDGWSVIGTGDFDGDAKADALWHNTSTGLVASWTSGNGFTVFDTEGGGWLVIGTGDFNGDGKADLLWHNTVNGAVSVLLTGGTYVSLDTEGGGWSVIGIGDFNGDGKADLLWHNTVNGAINGELTDGGYLGLSTEGGGWLVIGTGDFDGDGKTDLLWHNSATGLVASWTSNGSFVVFGVEGGGWQVIH